MITSWKKKDKEHLNLSSQLLNVILEGEKFRKDIKLGLNNHIKSLQIILQNNGNYFSCIHDHMNSIEQEELKISSMSRVLDTLSDEFKNVAQLEHDIFIIENKKGCLEYLLDDQDIGIGNLREILEANTNEAKSLESYLIEKVKMSRSPLFNF